MICEIAYVVSATISTFSVFLLGARKRQVSKLIVKEILEPS